MLYQHANVWSLGESSQLVNRLNELKLASKKIPKNATDEEYNAMEAVLIRNQTKAFLKDIKMTHEEDNKGKNVTRIIDKMLWNFRNIGIIQTMLPNSFIIHIVRDPLDSLLRSQLNPNLHYGPVTT
jgi:Sulfotransferase family